jgi:CheY-like chemotaxis protein
MNPNKILVVDDDIDVINILTTILKHEGFMVEFSLNKTDGFEKAKSFKPDVAILDVIMNTHYEGFELAKEFSQDPELKNIPVIIQTSIEVFATNLRSAADMAFEYRKDPRYKELQVVLLKDHISGEAGIDYRSDDGRSIWLPVKGFIKKPVEAARLLPEIHKLLHPEAV